MTGITRRAALASAGAAVAVAGAPGAVLGGEPAGAVNAALQQRYDEWEAAYQAFGRALDELAPVEQKVWAAAEERSIDRGTKAYEALKRELGLDAAQANEANASDREWEAYHCFLNTPSGSLQDMAWKIRTARKNEDSAAPTTLVQALSSDFERLLGRGGS